MGPRSWQHENYKHHQTDTVQMCCPGSSEREEVVWQARLEYLIPMPLQQILGTWMRNLGPLSPATASGNCVKASAFGGSMQTFLSARQPSRLTADTVWLPAWSNQTLLQVLAFLAVSLSHSSLICHGYLAFHGYFLKASEVCFAACMGLITGMSFEWACACVCSGIKQWQWRTYCWHRSNCFRWSG